MAQNDFDWTITGLDKTTRKFVWGTECSRCGEVRPMAGVDLLPRDEQEKLLVDLRTRHAGACRGD